MKRPRIGFVGGGNMAGALVRGLLGARLCRAGELLVSEPDAGRRRSLRRRFRVASARTNRALVRASDVVILAVKPQILREVLDEIRDDVTPDKLFVSIAAGFRIERLANGLGTEARLVRVMPNTPALLGKGMSVLVRGGQATLADERFALRLFRAVGDALAVRDERLLDAVTGLSGSGPAFVYRFAEALVEGGIREGLGEAVAARLAFQTLDGAAAMLKEASLTPRQLREMVSSPGGTTLAGLEVLERKHFPNIVREAVSVAARRSRELGALPAALPRAARANVAGR